MLCSHATGMGKEIKGYIMATPRVFVSSTCYDLKYIRENLRYFIKNMGFEPILSEKGSVFYNPTKHTHDSCINEIKNSQIFILIIGGRYGGKYKESEASITNKEYKTALELKIPIFTLVEQSVYNEHFVYQKNRENSSIINKIKFPSVDSLKIFEFINEVRSASINNAFSSFSDFSDIENYLKKQWAGMLYDFLQKENENKRIEDMFNQLSTINKNTEMISKQILLSVGTDKSKIEAELYETMFLSSSLHDFTYWKKKLTPKDVLRNDNFEDCIRAIVPSIQITQEDIIAISTSFSISQKKLTQDSKEYREVRNKMIEILKKSGKDLATYLNEA